MRAVKLYLVKKLFFLNIFFAKAWYSITMAATRKGAPLRKVENVYDIPDEFDWGTKYRKDPLNGMLDYMTHPTRLQDNLDKNKKFGDCDDHAIYWASVLKKSNLADKVWFAYYSMIKKGNGMMTAHAVCVYEKDGEEYWCDYRLPNKVEKDTWMIDSAGIYQCDYVAATKIEVEKLDAFDTPVFGKHEIFLNEDLK